MNLFIWTSSPSASLLTIFSISNLILNRSLSLWLLIKFSLLIIRLIACLFLFFSGRSPSIGSISIDRSTLQYRSFNSSHPCILWTCMCASGSYSSMSLWYSLFLVPACRKSGGELPSTFLISPIISSTSILAASLAPKTLISRNRTSSSRKSLSFTLFSTSEFKILPNDGPLPCLKLYCVGGLRMMLSLLLFFCVLFCFSPVFRSFSNFSVSECISTSDCTILASLLSFDMDCSGVGFAVLGVGGIFGVLSSAIGSRFGLLRPLLIGASCLFLAISFFSSSAL